MKRPEIPFHNDQIVMIDPTRDAAFDLLSAVLDRHRPLEEALDGLSRLDARDRAAGHRLAAAVLRRMGSLDAALEPFLKKAPPVPVRHILRIGAAGLLLLDTPAHAAVATAVAQARSRKLVPFCPLVNAVLRRVAEAGPAALEGLDGPRLDTPPWLWTAWGGAGPRHRRSPSARGAAGPDREARRNPAAGGRGAAHRVVALPARHPRAGSAGLRCRRLLGAGRRRRPAGAASRRPAGRTDRRSVCRAGGQDRPTCRRRRAGDRGRARCVPAGAAAGKSRAAAPVRGDGGGRRRRVASARPAGCGAAGRAVQRHRHDPPPSGCRPSEARRRHRRPCRRPGPSDRGGLRHAAARAAGWSMRSAPCSRRRGHGASRPLSKNCACAPSRSRRPNWRPAGGADAGGLGSHQSGHVGERGGMDGFFVARAIRT